MKGTIIAIDPGPIDSAYVVVNDNGRIVDHGQLDTEGMINMLEDRLRYHGDCTAADIVIEMIASYGMPVGAEVFETCVTIGRITQAVIGIGRGTPNRMTRLAVKMAICHSSRANDAAIRQRLLDIYGGKMTAIGRKGSPGPLYGIKADVWAALALAVAWKQVKEGSE